MNVLKQYLSLCWFKGKLTEFPASLNLLKYSLAFYLIVGLIVQANMTNIFEAFIDIVIEAALTFAFAFGFVASIKKRHLFIQITTAFFVCADLIYALAFPTIFWFSMSDSIIPMAIGPILGVWYLAIVTFLLKQMLVTDIYVAFMYSLLYLTVTYFGTFMAMMFLGLV